MNQGLYDDGIKFLKLFNVILEEALNGCSFVEIFLSCLYLLKRHWQIALLIFECLSLASPTTWLNNATHVTRPWLNGVKGMFRTVLKNSFLFFIFLFCKNKKIVYFIVFKDYFQKINFGKCNLKNKKQKIRFRYFQLFCEKCRKYYKNN